jgi:hypothetical protein
MSAVRLFTVLIAFCLAFRPAFMTVSDSEDRDLLDEMDAGRSRFRSAIMG